MTPHAVIVPVTRHMVGKVIKGLPDNTRIMRVVYHVRTDVYWMWFEDAHLTHRLATAPASRPALAIEGDTVHWILVPPRDSEHVHGLNIDDMDAEWLA